MSFRKMKQCLCRRRLLIRNQADCSVSEELDELVAPVEAEELEDEDPSSFLSESLVGFLNAYLVDEVSLQSPECSELVFEK